MENSWNFNDDTVDHVLLEKVNPVFNTAKMTLFQLAANGDTNAATLAKDMNLTLNETQNSANTKASPEQVLGGTIMLEIRYRTMARLAEESGYTVVDMPCGYTPRAIEFAKKGLHYYGLDLPVVILETSKKITALIPPKQREFIHFREVDATNYGSLEKAMEDIDGPVCIITEGLLMYFNDSEVEVLCDNIYHILKKKGGCWYTADVESSLQYVLIMRTLVGDRFMEIKKNAIRQTKDKSDVDIGKNTLNTTPADMSGSIRNAMDFLLKHGLKAERINVAEHMPMLNSLNRISNEQAVAVQESMKQCAFWKITLSGKAAEITSSETNDFHFNTFIQSGTLSLVLTGRLDTLTAPTLLSFFEKTKTEQPVDAVYVDCTHLDYISSAGRRVLLIMHNACKDGISIHGENERLKKMICLAFDDELNGKI